MEKLTTKEVAILTGASTSWLTKARMRKEGPPYLKIGRSVRYRRSDVEAWERAHTVETEQ